MAMRWPPGVWTSQHGPWGLPKTGSRSQPRFSVHHADGTVLDDAYFAVVMNTDPYTFLGNRPLHLTDEAGIRQYLVMGASTANQTNVHEIAQLSAPDTRAVVAVTLQLSTRPPGSVMTSLPS